MYLLCGVMAGRFREFVRRTWARLNQEWPQKPGERPKTTYSLRTQLSGYTTDRLLTEKERLEKIYDGPGGKRLEIIQRLDVVNGILRERDEFPR